MILNGNMYVIKRLMMNHDTQWQYLNFKKDRILIFVLVLCNMTFKHGVFHLWQTTIYPTDSDKQQLVVELLSVWHTHTKLVYSWWNAVNVDIKHQSLSSSPSFAGFIRIHMNLTRPITISLSRQPHPASDTDDDVKCLSFYLPHGTSKVIHIDW